MSKKQSAQANPPVTLRPTVDLETLGGNRRRLDLTTMRPLELSLRDWSTGIDIVDILMPTPAGSPVVHTYSRWSDGQGGVRGDRYFEPDDATLADLRQRFAEPELVAGGTRAKAQPRAR